VFFKQKKQKNCPNKAENMPQQSQENAEKPCLKNEYV